MRLVTWLRSLTSRVARPRSRRAGLSLEPLEERAVPSAAHDVLYVGDNADNTVKSYDATTGAYLGTQVASGSGGLNGPRGLIFRNPGQLLVVNQNSNTNFNGEVLRYNGETGVPLGAVVPGSDANAPFAPRGMVLGLDHTLYVADDGNLDGVTLGRLTRFNSETGAFLGDLKPTGFSGDFYPRSVVIGPDGLVYASVRNIAATGGEIMRWDPTTGQFLGVFAASNAANDLNRPEGLVFGPDGNLYVASFRANAADTDKIVEFSGSTGAYAGKIDLDAVGGPRAFAQALEFGPGGQLFVPITADGSIRSYDVATHNYTVFVAAGGALAQPLYLTFGQTNAATLAYDTRPGAETRSDQVFSDPQTAAPSLSADVITILLAGKKQHDPFAEV
jgi:DNA-binding beta-propeller fold protein YncE